MMNVIGRCALDILYVDFSPKGTAEPLEQFLKSLNENY